MRDFKKMSRDLNVILKNASSCVRDDKVDSRIQARCEVLETLDEMKDMTLNDRLKLINQAYQGVDLEETLNISKEYYRERYFALLEFVAKSIKTDK